MHMTHSRNKQNIWNLELALFCPKHKFRNETVVSSRFLWKKIFLCAGINVTFYLFMISVALSSNVIFFLVPATFNALPTNVIFLHLSFTLRSPFRKNSSRFLCTTHCIYQTSCHSCFFLSLYMQRCHINHTV